MASFFKRFTGDSTKSHTELRQDYIDREQKCALQINEINLKCKQKLGEIDAQYHKLTNQYLSKEREAFKQQNKAQVDQVMDNAKLDFIHSMPQVPTHKISGRKRPRKTNSRRRKQRRSTRRHRT